MCRCRHVLFLGVITSGHTRWMCRCRHVLFHASRWADSSALGMPRLVRVRLRLRVRVRVRVRVKVRIRVRV